MAPGSTRSTSPSARSTVRGAGASGLAAMEGTGGAVERISSSPTASSERGGEGPAQGARPPGTVSPGGPGPAAGRAGPGATARAGSEGLGAGGLRRGRPSTAVSESGSARRAPHLKQRPAPCTAAARRPRAPRPVPVPPRNCPPCALGRPRAARIPLVVG